MRSYRVLFLVMGLMVLVTADYARFIGQSAGSSILYTEVQVGWADYGTKVWKVIRFPCEHNDNASSCLVRDDVWVDMWMDEKQIYESTIKHNLITRYKSWCNGEMLNLYCEYYHNHDG